MASLCKLESISPAKWTTNCIHQIYMLTLQIGQYGRIRILFISELPPWETMMSEYHYVIHQPLVKKDILLPLHIKLGQMKQFTKALK